MTMNGQSKLLRLAELLTHPQEYFPTKSKGNILLQFCLLKK